MPSAAQWKKAAKRWRKVARRERDWRCKTEEALHLVGVSVSLAQKALGEKKDRTIVFTSRSDVPKFSLGRSVAEGVFPDRCSIHGDIPLTVSVVQHLKDVHGLSYDEWLTLGGEHEG